MPIQDSYTNLPGFVSQINDNGLKIQTTPQTLSQSVLLFGTATDGPSNTPVVVQSVANAEQIFGVTTAANSITATGGFNKALTRGVYEAYQAGATSIILCRVGGTAATATAADTVGVNSLILTAGYNGAKYNSLSVAVTAVAGTAAGTLQITTLDSIAHQFSFTSSTLWGDLINTVNSAQLNVLASQGSSGNPLGTVQLITLASTAFATGTDGTNMTDTQYSNALTAAYLQLEGFTGADAIVPLGAYLQSTANGGDTVYFGLNLAQFVARVSVRTHSAFGVIATPPLAVPTFSNAVTWIGQLQATTYTFQYQAATSAYPGGYAIAGVGTPGAALGTDGKIVDIGYLLNIVVGPDPIVNNPQIGNYQIDGAATYAGFAVSLPPQNATTNKIVPSVIATAYTMGASVLNSLVGNKMVCFQNINGSVKVVADQTYSLAGHDYVYLSTLRITYACMEAVRGATQQFIGQAANAANINAMGTAINTVLTAIQNAGALLDFSYAMNASAQDQISGNMQITLGLVPALQIRKIIVTISLTPPSAFSVAGGGTSSAV